MYCISTIYGWFAKHRIFLTGVLIATVWLPGFAVQESFAVIKPLQTVVLINRNVPESGEIARYYMEKRNIPEKNRIAFDLPDDETISRDIYVNRLAEPLRRFLHQTDPKGRIRCLVLIYGFPLRISQERVSRNGTGLQNDTESSLDSELAMVLEEDYSIEGWIPNPYYLGNRKKNGLTAKEKILIVARIDGPTARTARRIIDDSLFAEKYGLGGRAYFDARWPRESDSSESDYKKYDLSIHKAAERIETNNIMPVTIESTEKLFEPGQCPNAALYCGWYSLAEYVDAFSWERGSVGYHIASAECRTLKQPNDSTWCKRMLEEGIAAAIGPVGEPYVQSFPVPEIFFHFLTDGYLSLGECYMLSSPYLSWKLVLVGDPLYQPFKPADGTKDRDRPE